MAVSHLCLKDAPLSFAAFAAVAVVIMDKKMIPKTIKKICLKSNQYNEFSHFINQEKYILKKLFNKTKY